MTTPDSRPICTWSDLHVDECAHCSMPGVTVTSVEALERHVQRPLPQYRTRDRSWHVPDPRPLLCEHRKEDICPDCDRTLDDLLYDLPELLHQLGVAMRKQTSFKPSGHRQGDLEKPDEAPIPWNPVAAGCMSDLNRLMRNRWPDRRGLLVQLSTLAARAHRVIDRPKDREYSMCPQCRDQIDVQDRTLITCPKCHYHASWEQHQADLLDANGDAMLTLADLVMVLTRAGEKVDRNRINYLISRHGLPREQVQLPTWRDGELKPGKPMWVYRLRDVRELSERLTPSTREAS